VKFSKFLKIGWLCLAKASAKPTKFNQLSEFDSGQAVAEGQGQAKLKRSKTLEVGPGLWPRRSQN
jgi:hypothetical protein